MSPQTLDQPDILTEVEEEAEQELPWNVILYNDDHHSFDEVVIQVQKATGRSLEHAYAVTFEAHTKGRAVCYTGPLERCEHVAGVLREIGLTADIEKAD